MCRLSQILSAGVVFVETGRVLVVPLASAASLAAVYVAIQFLPASDVVFVRTFYESTEFDAPKLRKDFYLDTT